MTISIGNDDGSDSAFAGSVGDNDLQYTNVAMPKKKSKTNKPITFFDWLDSNLPKKKSKGFYEWLDEQLAKA